MVSFYETWMKKLTKKTIIHKAAITATKRCTYSMLALQKGAVNRVAVFDALEVVPIGSNLQRLFTHTNSHTHGISSHCKPVHLE